MEKILSRARLARVECKMPPLMQDITGMTFGKLTALEVVSRQHRAAVWRCHCACGKLVDVKLGNLRGGNTRSCGCLRRKSDE